MKRSILGSLLLSPDGAEGGAGISQIGSAFATLDRMAGVPDAVGGADGEGEGGTEGESEGEGGQGDGDGGEGEGQDGEAEGAGGEGQGESGAKGQEGQQQQQRKEQQSQRQEQDRTQQQQQTQQTQRVRARDLKTALTQARQETAQLKAENERLQTELKKPKDDPRVKELETRVETMRKEIEDYENKLQRNGFLHSKKYQSQYQKPFEDAYLDGANEIKTFTFTEAGGETDPLTGERTGGARRQATQQDWDKFLMLGHQEANEFAFEHFGHNAPQLINMRLDVLRLAKARDAAVAQNTKEGAELTKAETEAAQKANQAFRQTYQSSLDAAMADEELAIYLTADEGDTDGAATLKRGFELADRAFGDTSKMDPQERADLYAAVRNRAAAFGYMRNQLSALAAENEELQAKLKAFEDSEPGHEGDHKGKGGEGGEMSGMAYFEANARKAARVS